METDRRERRNLAAQTVMPAALSELIEYASTCLKFLAQFHPHEYGLLTATLNLPVPAVPSESILALKECIEFADKSVADIVADLLSKIQIQQSRLVVIAQRVREPEKIITRMNINTYVIDALEVHARVSKLFPYARRDTQAGPMVPTIDDIRQSARLCDVDEAGAGISEQIDRWRPNLERL